MEPEHADQQHHCADCSYFREDEVDTGYCQLHSMFVLRMFGCQKFIQRFPENLEGGEAQERSEKEVENVGS